MCRLSFSLSLSFRLALSPRAFCLALMRTYVRTYIRMYTRVSICMREKPERKEIPVARGGRQRGRGEWGSRGKEWKRLRKRSEVSRTLDEADATPTERHPREKPSPRSPRLLHLLPSSLPLVPFPSSTSLPLLALLSLLSARVHEMRWLCEDLRFLLWTGLYVTHIPIPNSSHINRHTSARFAFASNNRALARRTSRRSDHKSGESCSFKKIW